MQRGARMECRSRSQSRVGLERRRRPLLAPRAGAPIRDGGALPHRRVKGHPFPTRQRHGRARTRRGQNTDRMQHITVYSAWFVQVKKRPRQRHGSATAVERIPKGAPGLRRGPGPPTGRAAVTGLAARGRCRRQRHSPFPIPQKIYPSIAFPVPTLYVQLLRIREAWPAGVEARCC
eukprot:gene13753-biopygen12993